MKRKINLALIGAGSMGRLWAKAIKETKGVVPRVVIDIDEKSALSISQRFPGCIAVKDWHKILANNDIDAVLVTTPHKWLAPISLAALKAGKHVFCEKPSGVTVAEVTRNIILAKKKNLVYMPGFNHRYHPAYMKAREIFEKGGIGEANFIRARYGFGGRPGYNKEWRFNKEVAGGGELLDQGVHMIDMARWFLGDFEKIYGFAENFFWGGDVEDNGFLLMRTKKGQVASIHVSSTNWEWVHSFEIFGDKGYLLIDGLDQRYNGPEQLTWGKRDKTFARPQDEKYVFEKEQKHDAMRREMENFVRAIHGGAPVRKLFPRGEDARAALKLVEKIYKNKHGNFKK
ncbi:MAG: Gfo/Idh/MocA family oxidoreductase [bacterium]|nr:Gfo/Idh/MocA family oxidoreductase [bacterium]